MLTTTQAKEYAELSQAAYAYFDEGDFSGRGALKELCQTMKCRARGT